jgi:hypothetical protein
MIPENTNIQIVTTELKHLIEQSRQNVAVAVNAEITLLYWNIGKRINQEVLNFNRAEYGKQIVATLSRHLTEEYGSGWSKRQLHHCMRMAEVFPEIQIVHALRTQLTWTHLRQIISIEDALKRDFYIEICKLERWSSRQLQERINSMLYERTCVRCWTCI